MFFNLFLVPLALSLATHIEPDKQRKIDNNQDLPLVERHVAQWRQGANDQILGPRQLLISWTRLWHRSASSCFVEPRLTVGVPTCALNALTKLIICKFKGIETYAIAEPKWFSTKTFTPFGVPGCKPEATLVPQTGVAYIVSKQSLYLLDPPSAHIPSFEKPGIELPTDCLRGSRLKARLFSGGKWCSTCYGL